MKTAGFTLSRWAVVALLGLFASLTGSLRAESTAKSPTAAPASASRHATQSGESAASKSNPSGPVPAPDLANNPAPTAKPLNPALPSIFIAGDSTAAKGKGEIQQGWGVPFADYFDPAKVNVVNRARGGRSARTYITEGLWDQLLAETKAGDVVLIQFGHNDGSPINAGRARGSLPGLGEETETIENIVTKKTEVVHTFGWYLRKMIADVKAKKATPILLSLTIRNIWRDGRLERGAGVFQQWTHDTAIATAVQYVDLTTIMADQLEPMGQEALKALYQQDHTHFNARGADMHAAGVVAGLKGLDWKKQPGPVKGLLSAKGEAVAPESTAWLKLPVPARPGLPTLFLVGDSTVRNGVGDGIDGQWGWGDSLPACFDLAKVNIVNRAVGGTSSRSFRSTGYWDRVLKMMKPGDFVIIQFGHNDNGDRGGLPGIDETTQTRTDEKTKQTETVHTFGWYLRQYISDTRAKGATPILCSLVPRKKWADGKIVRSKDTHAGWAEQVAKAENAPFLDLNELVARRYDALGQEKVNALFADEHTHTTKAGANLNAETVVDALRGLPQDPLAPYLKAEAK
ncbi:GDSL family lipase [Opitutaceae bacterium EW11]|nr:GDSL family lipase [Opitutaceae bacterium EW11]